MSDKIQIETVTGPGIETWLEAAARLRIQVFREYPYLYDGDISNEMAYFSHFVRAPGSVLVLARVNHAVVGCATAMAMAGAEPAFQRPFVEQDMRLDRIFYFGESVLDARFRGQGIGHRFFDQRQAQARRHGADTTAFCVVQRPGDHPLRPPDYRPLDAFWRKRGYVRRDDLNTEFSWKDIDQAAETRKKMVFWTKE